MRKATPPVSTTMKCLFSIAATAAIENTELVSTFGANKSSYSDLSCLSPLATSLAFSESTIRNKLQNIDDLKTYLRSDAVSPDTLIGLHVTNCVSSSMITFLALPP